MNQAAPAPEAGRRNGKSAAAFRTISEVASELDVPTHVLRFWETRFTQVRPLKRGGGRRYYRPEDVDLLRNIRRLLYGDGYTIKGVQKLLREGAVKGVAVEPPPPPEPAPPAPSTAPSTALPAAGGGLDGAQRGALGELLAELESLRDLLKSDG